MAGIGALEEIIHKRKLNPAVTITETSITTSFSMAGGHTMFYALGRHWVFYSDGSFLVFSTSTDGISWSLPTQVRACNYGTLFDIWFDGNKVHYVCLTSIASSLFYGKGIPSGDGSIAWELEYSILPSGTKKVPIIAVDSNGFPWIGLRYNDYPYILQSINQEGSEWVTHQLSSITSAWRVLAVPMMDGKLCALLLREGVSNCKSRIWDGSLWDGEQTITTDSIKQWAGCAVADGDVIHFAYGEPGSSSASNNIKHCKRTGGIWESPITLASYQGSDARWVALSKNENDGTLYAFWMSTISPTERNVVFSRYISGVWEEITILAPSELNCVDPSSTRSSDTNIGCVWRRDNNPYEMRFINIAIGEEPPPLVGIGALGEIFHEPSNVVPGVPFQIKWSLRNDGASDTIWWKLYKPGITDPVVSFSTGIGAGQTFQWAFYNDTLEETTTYVLDVGHGYQMTAIDNTYEYEVPVGEIPELCQWITDHGGHTGLSITDIFEIIDSYLFGTPPPGYAFIPILENVFGVIDYFLGFDGNPATGCSF